MKKLSTIINGFIIKWLFLPATLFIILFSVLRLMHEVEDLKRQQIYYAESLSHHVRAYIKDCAADINHAIDHISSNNLEALKIGQLVGSSYYFYSFHLLDENFRVIKSIPDQHIQQDFSGIIKKGNNPEKFFLTTPYYSPFTNKIVVAILSADKNGNYLMAELNLITLEKFIKELTLYLKNGSAFITDSYGNIIAHSDMSLVKRQENIGNLNIIKQVGSKKPLSGFYKNDNELKLMSAALIPVSNWKVVIQQNAFAICMDVLLSSSLSFAAALAVLFIFLFQFNKRLYKAVVKPVSEFTKYIEYLRDFGNKNSGSEKFELNKNESFIEINELQLKFFEMQQAIKKREIQLEENQKMYRAVVQDTPVLICSFLPDGEITFANKAYCKYFKKTSKELIGTNFLELIPEYDRKTITDGLDKLTPENPLNYTEHHVIAANGEIRWQRWTDRALFDDNNIPYLYQAIGEDITERKENQEKLSQERERLAVTLRSIGDGVITTDTDGRVVLVNKVAEQLTGWSQKEARGRPLPEIFRIIHEDTREIHINPVEQVLKSGEIVELANHTILIAKNGKERIISDSGAPIKNKDSQTIGVVLVFRDMTDKKKMQETLQNTAKLESLGVLAGGIAHDFNNLLGGIFGYIDLALRVSREERVAEFLEKSMNTIERARNLTGQLLTFSKGGSPLRKIGPLFPFVEDTANFALSGSNINCGYQIDDNLMLCNYDKNQIGQVIDNIIINAKQAMPNGGNIEIKAQNTSFYSGQHPTLPKGDYIKISIKDTGPGIPQNMISKIFDPFFTTKPQGHGIGLATSYSIIEKHYGAIDVESYPDKGTTFIIYLPATPEKIEGFRNAKSDYHAGSGTILIMDDEEIILEMTSEMLKSFGYQSVKTKNGLEAVEYFKNNKDSLTAAICDLTIPGGMGGKEAVREIRKYDNKIPVFVASGYSEDPVMDNPEEYGFTASIPKPFKRSDLSRLLNAYLKPLS